MRHFTLLLFDWDDRVSAVRTIRASSIDDAVRIANVAAQAHPDSAGYQLWHGGRRIMGTYPEKSEIPAAALLSTASNSRSNETGN